MFILMVMVWQEPALIAYPFGFYLCMGITYGVSSDYSRTSPIKLMFSLEWVLMIFWISAALENTILKWSSDHRKHHNKPESEEDPYSITKGFWYSHI